MKIFKSLRESLHVTAIARLCIAMIAVAITVFAQWSVPVPDHFIADEWLRDSFIRVRASEAAESRVTVVDIDEGSLAKLGPWPWPRARLADLAENLLIAYDAKAVALDLLMPEVSDTEGDTRLAMLSRDRPLVLAQAFDYVRRPTPLRVGTLAGGKPHDPQRKTVPAEGFIANHPGFAQARTTGNIGFLPDGDGTIRRLPLTTGFTGRQYPTLALALLECCGDMKSLRRPAGPGLWRIPFNYSLGAYEVVPASEVLELRAPAAALRGRYILVGSSSLGLSDRLATPLSASTSGVMVHAEALSSLLDLQAGSAKSPWPGRAVALMFSVVVALSAAYMFPRLSAIASVGMLAVASLAWLGLAFWISPHDAEFSMTAPIASNLFLLAVAVPFDWQLTQRKSRRLLGTLNQYVAKAVVDALLRSDLKNPLVPQRRNVTTLIADMEGYTTHVEALPMEAAAQLTRDFLDCLTRPVLEKLGTLDKYTGDGLVAFWGAPLPIEEHADLALDAAQEIVARVREFSVIRALEGKPPLRVRIGIESGVAMAGDFGTSFRSIYTAVGDSVNTASRLEQVARDLPYDVIVGQGTVDAAKRHRFIRLREVLLRGKEKPTVIYALSNEPVTKQDID